MLQKYAEKRSTTFLDCLLSTEWLHSRKQMHLCSWVCKMLCRTIGLSFQCLVRQKLSTKVNLHITIRHNNHSHTYTIYKEAVGQFKHYSSEYKKIYFFLFFLFQIAYIYKEAFAISIKKVK